MKQRSTVLSDHRRQGKRLIPRLAELNMHELKWAEEMLPEFLWLALLNDAHGYAAGAEAARLVARAARAIRNGGSPRWFALLGEYAAFDDNEREGFLRGLTDSRMLHPLRDGLRPLAASYPGNPLQFLFREASPVADPEGLRRLKAVVASIYPRASTEATRVQANALYLAFDGDVLKVTPESRLANFPEVQHYPETEESRVLGGLVRASISNLFPIMGERPTPWSASFWARGLEVESCVMGDDDE